MEPRYKLKIWVVLEVSGFTSESNTYLFTDMKKAFKKFGKLKEKWIGYTKLIPGECIIEEDDSLWISGKILDDGTDKYIRIFEQEVD